MNRGHVLQSPLVQQMLAGNPNWWNINNMRPPSQQNSPFLPPLPPYSISEYTSQPPPPPPRPSSSSSSSLPFPSSWHANTNQEQQLPESWSQLLLGGLVSEEDKSCLSEMDHHHQQQQVKELENWEEQLLSQQPQNGHASMEIKLEDSSNSSYLSANNVWTQMMPNSSPKSCVTSLSTSMLDFSSKKADGKHPPPDHSPECNSSAGGALKKARVQPSSTQPTFKVRKEKLGDRITALHQIVSPFGKTDTASVLLEAIGYIRFLQSQIEALSLPYLGNTGPGNMRQQQPVQGERNCLFPEDPGQVSHEEPKKDLRSRGLCLVPISCTMQVGSDNGADYWAPAIGGGFQ